MSAIQSVLIENRVFPPSEATVKAARISGMAAYQALCDEAERDFNGFWGRLAKATMQPRTDSSTHWLMCANCAGYRV